MLIITRLYSISHTHTHTHTHKYKNAQMLQTSLKSIWISSFEVHL